MPEKLYARPLLAVACIAIHTASAGAAEMSADLTLTTDYVFRGVSQTMSAPALQGGLTIEHENGLFASPGAQTWTTFRMAHRMTKQRLKSTCCLATRTRLSDRVTVTAAGFGTRFPACLKTFATTSANGAARCGRRPAPPHDCIFTGRLWQRRLRVPISVPQRYSSCRRVSKWRWNSGVTICENSYDESYTHAAVSIAGGFRSVRLDPGLSSNERCGGKDLPRVDRRPRDCTQPEPAF